jgi:ketosteroid isomerase-like protein
MPDLEVASELIRVLRSVEAGLFRRAPAAEIAEIMYNPEVVVVGEGAPAASFGRDAFMPVLAGIIDSWGSRPKLRFEICEGAHYAPDFAATFVDVTVERLETPGEPERFRCLMVWRKAAGRWRISCESFSLGTMGRP